jgi:hypothetical protein
MATVVRAEDDQPTKLTLHPMAAPTPALKYRLLPPADELVSGNAAVPYGKITAEQLNFFGHNFTDTLDKWREMPLDKLRAEKISLPESSIFFLEQGAKCKYCDWQLPIGQIPFYRILLPEAQQTRSYARLLAVKARIEVANGKFDDAINTFQTNYALAHNVAQGESLIHGLLGVAIGSIMFPEISEYVQQPDAPNLYWALSALPSPIVNMNNALDVERQALVLSFPELRDVQTARRSPEEWREVFHRIAQQVIELTTTGKPPVPNPVSLEELEERCEQNFPAIKRRLIADGVPEKKAETMDVHQAAFIYTMSVSREMFDDAAKYYSLPYPEAMQGMDAAFDRAKAKQGAGEIVPLAETTQSVFQSTRGAIARGDRRIAILRVFEALRIYAAAHDGALPEKLADITEVPVPVDPVTGQPFEYAREGNKARLHGATLANVREDYEITMAPRQ